VDFESTGNKVDLHERPGHDSKEQSMLEQIGKLRLNEENAKNA